MEWIQPLHEYDDINDIGRMSLCEYPEWTSRRQFCNLIIMVGKERFELHTFPLLLQSPVLAQRAATNSNVIHFPTFPGGAEAFELVCIYAYTHCVEYWTTRTIAFLFVASRVLKMNSNVKKGISNLEHRSQLYVDDIVEYSSLSDVIAFLNYIDTLRKESPFLSVMTDVVVVQCINRLAAAYPFSLATLSLFQVLPCELFLQVTQKVISQRAPHYSNNVLSILCGQTHLAQVFESSTRDTEQKSAVLFRILEDILHTQSKWTQSTSLAIQVASDMGILSNANVSPAVIRNMEESVLAKKESPSSTMFK